MRSFLPAETAKGCKTGSVSQFSRPPGPLFHFIFELILPEAKTGRIINIDDAAFPRRCSLQRDLKLPVLGHVSGAIDGMIRSVGRATT
jgi:hypothetical protein